MSPLLDDPLVSADTITDSKHHLTLSGGVAGTVLHSE